MSPIEGIDDLRLNAEYQAAADLRAARASRLWPKAVTTIHLDLENSNLAWMVRERIKEKGAGVWIHPLHFDWGMTMRNFLRDMGFGEKEFGIQNLDNIYVELIEEAVQ